MSIPFRSLTPFLHVADVRASIAFYERLGFGVRNTLVPTGASEPVWAWLQSDGCALMVGRASGPVDAEQQAIIVWLYVDDVAAKHAELSAAGIDVAKIEYPPWNARGEFRFKDPDGYDLFIAHT